jgi:hypothetical protein
MKREHIFAFCIIAITGLLFVILSGSVFSGYHFMDCGMYIRYGRELSEHSWWECLINCINDEYHLRFRPVWHLNTILKTMLWGDNLLLQGLWQIFQNIIAAYLTYCLGRKMKWTHNESILFAGISLTGMQSAVFYQTLAIETPALIMLLLSWHCILIYFTSQGIHKVLSYISFILFAVSASLMKENFLLVLPAHYLFYCIQYNDKYPAKFLEILLHTWKTGLCMLLLLMGGLLAVLTFAGSDFGYAGMESFTSIFPYLKSSVYLYGVSGCAFAIPVVLYLFWSKKIRWDAWLFPLLFFAAITVPQIILYSKSNIIDRYLIPAMLGCSYFSIFTYRELKKRDCSINGALWKNISLLAGMLLLMFFGSLVFSESMRQALISFAVNVQGNVLQSMTSVSSMRYLQNTLSIIAVTGLIAAAVLFAAGSLRKNDFLKKLSQLYISILLLILLVNGGLAFASCKRYAMRGFATESFLRAIIDHSKPSDAVLIAGSPLIDMEAMQIGIREYLLKYNRHNLFVYPVATIPAEKDLTPYLMDIYNRKHIGSLADKESIKVVAIFPGSEDLFMSENDWFDAQLFNRYEFTGNYVAYVTK